jgi:hypothetical protein
LSYSLVQLPHLKKEKKRKEKYQGDHLMGLGGRGEELSAISNKQVISKYSACTQRVLHKCLRLTGSVY